MRLAIKVILWTAIILSAATLVFSLVFGYQQSIAYLLPHLNSVKHPELVLNILTPKVFRYIQLYLAFIVFIFSALLYYVDRFYPVLSNFFSAFFLSLKKLVVAPFKSELGLILIVPLLSSFILAIYVPLYIDEGITYLDFTTRGIASAMSWYPAPNNHVLNSIISTFTYHIPFLPALIKLRITAVVVNILTWILCYTFLLRYYNKNFALVITAIASTLFFAVFYSYLCRGYGMVVLFFIAMLFSAFCIIKENGIGKYWTYFAISSILGFYTMPSFLYPFLSVNVLIFLLNPKYIIKQIMANVAISISVVILYLPIIVVNGVSALANNRFVTPLPRAEVLNRLPYFFSDCIYDVTGISWYFVVALLLISFCFVLVQKQRQSITIFIIFLLAPLVLLTLHSVIPFTRTFNYYIFLLPFLFGLPFYKYLANANTKLILSLAIVAQCALLYNFYTENNDCINKSIHTGPKSCEDLCYSFQSYKVINEIKGDKKYLVDDPNFDVPLEFYLKTEGYSKHEFKYLDSRIVDVDTINNFDYVIVSYLFDKTKTKTPVYKSNDWSLKCNIYKQSTN